MAAGKPIVTTDVPGCRDLIAHEHTGLLVPYGDTPALTAALSRLLGDANLARRLGDTAQSKVAAHWSAASAWNSSEALYRSILTPPPLARTLDKDALPLETV